MADVPYVHGSLDLDLDLDLDIIMSQDHCCDMDATWSGGALYTVFLQTSLKAV